MNDIYKELHFVEKGNQILLLDDISKMYTANPNDWLTVLPGMAGELMKQLHMRKYMNNAI